MATPAIVKGFSIGARLLVTAGLIAILAARFDLRRAGEIMGQASLFLSAASVSALATAIGIGGLRWHLILAARGSSPGPVALLKMMYVGAFFNQVLPTGVGGDVVRAWRCAKLSIGLGVAIRSILLDRACGYLVLVVIYIAAFPSLLRVLPGANERAAMLAILGTAILGLAALGSVDVLPRRLLRLRFIAPLAELSRDSRRLLGEPRLCTAVLALSALTMALTIGAFKLIADAIGSTLPFGTWAMIVPPVTLIQLVPVSLAGWGVREAALVVALGSFGVPAEAALAVSVLVGFSLILVGLPGGLIWLVDWDIARARRP